MFHLESVLPRAYTIVLHRTVSFLLPTHPPWVILFDVIGWQRGLLDISLAVVYFLFVSLINFSPCQKANCVLFVSGSVVGEFNSYFRGANTCGICVGILVAMAGSF